MKKIFMILVVLFVLFMIAAIAIPVIYKDKVVETVKDEINKNLNANVEFGSVDLSILSSLPDLKLGLEDLQVIGHEQFSSDTLVAAKRLDLKLDIFSILKGSNVKVKSVKFIEPRVNLIVLQDGTANYDIMKSDESEVAATGNEGTEFNFNLKNYAIEDAYFDYEDMESDFRITLNDFDHNGSGDLSAKSYTLSTSTEVSAMDLWQGGVHYINNAKADIASNIDVDVEAGRYSFQETNILLNELELSANGFVTVAEEILLNVDFLAAGNEFKNFVSMVPGIYKEGFEDVDASGTMSFSGFVKGSYSETKSPGFGLDLQLNDGRLKYPDLKSELNNVKVDLHLKNMTGVPDHTVIELEEFNADFGGEKIEARLLVKNPATDPDIDGMLKCDLDLSKIRNVIPLESTTKLNGLINADVTAKGKLSAIENEDYRNFDAKGTVFIQAMDYDSPEFTQPLRISVLSMSFNPRNVAVHDFNANYGKSDFQANGAFDNFLMYALKDENLKGTFNVFSQRTDLNTMMLESGSEAAAAAEKESSVINVPANLELDLNASIAKIFYEDIVLQNVLGSIQVIDKEIIMRGVNFDLLEGKVKLSGMYSSKNLREPDMNFDLKIFDMDIKKTYDHFATVSKIAPLARQCSGKYSTQLKIKSKLDQNLDPIEKSISGKGRIQSDMISLQGASVLDKIGDALKMSQLKSTILKNVNISYTIKDGRLYVEEFRQNISGVDALIVGSNGFDQTIDYDMDFAVPAGLMSGAAVNNVQGMMDKLNSSAGTNVSIGDKVKLKIAVEGTVTDPIIKTRLKEDASNIKQEIKAQIKDELNIQKQELENKARDEADKLKQEAEAKLKAEQDRLKQEAEKKKQEAEQKAKEEADRLKKEAEEKAKKEAENAVKNLFKKPK